MSLGAFLAASQLGFDFEISLAVESAKSEADIYRANFGQFCQQMPLERFEKGRIHEGKVDHLFDGQLGTPLTSSEKDVRRACKNTHLLVGGPPCQGNSDLNNHSRRSDVRNALYERMARAAEVLRPAVVLIENVPAVIHDKNQVVDKTEQVLAKLGYSIARTAISCDRLGVPQRRRRHLLICIMDQDQDLARRLADELHTGSSTLEGRDIRWAIEDLLEFCEAPGTGGFNAPSAPSTDNQSRLDYYKRNKGVVRLPDTERPACHRNGGHSYKSIYGRMTWDKPAQTITTGYGSMGQGCFVHPGQLRTITPHEAARLQTFPDFFKFSSTQKRTVWAKAIGNAVPPIAMREIVKQILRVAPPGYSFTQPQ